MTTGRTPNLFELSDLATNRILFVLTLLGVVLPLNLLTSKYNQVGFSYQHFRFHAVAFFYSMEILLALAVYFYAFNLVFRRRFLEYIGTGVFAVALLVPLIYLYTGACGVVFNETTKWLGPVLSVVQVVIGTVLFLGFSLAGSIGIFKGLEGQGAPAATETKNDLGERLLKLEGLMKTGQLKQEEYDAKRAEIIKLI